MCKCRSRTKIKRLRNADCLTSLSNQGQLVTIKIITWPFALTQFMLILVVKRIEGGCSGQLGPHSILKLYILFSKQVLGGPIIMPVQCFRSMSSSFSNPQLKLKYYFLFFLITFCKIILFLTYFGDTINVFRYSVKHGYLATFRIYICTNKTTQFIIHCSNNIESPH